jgi:ribosomal protein S18 acetylase RimI-like enzyme
LNLLIDTNPDTLLVAEDNDTIVGTLIVAFDGWRGNMYRLAILPEYRRRGHARHLVDEGERRLRQRGVRRITALVAHEQPGATQFWEAVGYNLDRYTVRHVKHCKDPSRTLDTHPTVPEHSSKASQNSEVQVTRKAG